MKKFFALALTAITLLTLLCPTVFASSAPSTDTSVYVTIADNTGKLVLTQEKITVTDTDNDGTLTINDALYCAHEAKYTGGAAAGYASADTTFGLSLTKLWGIENGGSYGYYLNNAMAWSLADAVTDGDQLCAFIYTDTTAYSDTFCFFDKNTVSGKVNDEVTLTLSKYQWNSETSQNDKVAVSNATITIDGTATQYKTDENGSVTVKLDKSGTVVISATSETETLVPPACVATVEAEQPAAPSDTVNDPEPTNHTALIVVCSVVAVVIIAGAVIIITKKKA